MIQNWSIRSRATHCALSERPFEEGEVFHTAIYFDPEANGYVRRDVAIDVWPQEIAERRPIAYWRTTYTPHVVEARPEVTSKESAMALLQRFIEEDDPMTENARYILALMLERKRILSPTATKEVDGNKMLFYENKKTGEVFIVRDPELRLDELATLQDEVAMLLGFGGPAAEAAKAAGMKFTADGKLVKEGEAATTGETTPDEAAAAPESTETPSEEVASEQSGETAEAESGEAPEPAEESGTEEAVEFAEEEAAEEPPPEADASDVVNVEVEFEVEIQDSAESAEPRVEPTQETAEASEDGHAD
jgi:hypothetical protein